MKRFILIAAALVVTVLAWRLVSSSNSSARPVTTTAEEVHSPAPAGTPTDAGTSVASTPVIDSSNPELRSASAKLDSSAAGLDKFVSSPDNGSDSKAETRNVGVASSAAAAPPPVPTVSNASTEGVGFNARFHSRGPRVCPNIASPPNAAEATVLIQCTMDSETPQQMKLQQDIAVQLFSPRKPHNDEQYNRIDSRYPVLDLLASATVYLCGPVFSYNAGSNCDSYRFQNAPGVCWKNLDGDYRCMISAGLPPNVTRNQPAPTTL